MKRGALILIIVFMIALTAVAKIPERDPLAGITPGPDGKIDILTVFAHQDDEGFYGGGTLLKLKEDPRVRLHILCLTLGDMSVAKDRLHITQERLGQIRSQELRTAAAVYGAEEVIQFQYHDQGLSSADQEKLIGEIVEVINRTAAELIFTHDPGGITAHPDHQACSRMATAAFKRSNAQKLYYVTYPKWVYKIEYGAGNMQSVYGISVNSKVQPVYPEFSVNIHKQKKLKRMVLYAHASQKHFSEVGPLMEVVRLMNHEYFAEARKD